MKDESFEKQIKFVALKNKEWNKDKPAHLHKPTTIKKIRRIGRKVLQELETKIKTNEQ